MIFVLNGVNTGIMSTGRAGGRHFIKGVVGGLGYTKSYPGTGLVCGAVWTNQRLVFFRIG